MSNAVVNYCFNKFCPFLVVGALLFLSFEVTDWIPYAILLMVLFIERFSFKVGYSVGFCEKNDLLPADIEK
tara:strand:+ start:299 stop:511 length:213 start_codon:yes stop_codon:yes gene_type:complete